MLRIGFLPSDFNPMVLLLGDAEDFRALGGVLRSFARQQADVRLDEMGFCAASNTALLLTGSDGPPGIHLDAGNAVTWRIDAPRAAGFAAQLDTLANPSLLSGSEMLECSTEDEIPVKASRGEYTDDFLAAPGPTAAA